MFDGRSFISPRARWEITSFEVPVAWSISVQDRRLVAIRIAVRGADHGGPRDRVATGCSMATFMNCVDFSWAVSGHSS